MNDTTIAGQVYTMSGVDYQVVARSLSKVNSKMRIRVKPLLAHAQAVWMDEDDFLKQLRDNRKLNKS